MCISDRVSGDARLLVVGRYYAQAALITVKLPDACRLSTVVNQIWFVRYVLFVLIGQRLVSDLSIRKHELPLQRVTVYNRVWEHVYTCELFSVASCGVRPFDPSHDITLRLI